jgi:hypothetical protein
MREAQVNLAIRWFSGYGLREELPNHSSLTRIHQLLPSVSIGVPESALIWIKDATESWAWGTSGRDR